MRMNTFVASNNQMKRNYLCIPSFLFIFTVIVANGALATTITFVNDCGFTVWPGISGRPLSNITGFELAEGNSRTLQTLGDWKGQIWGRTGCTFNGSGHGSCKTGDCGSGEMECNGKSASPPVTVAELDITKFEDLYNVNLFNGYNLQMTVEATGGSRLNVLDCVKAGCVDNLTQRCPTELMSKGGGGCNTVCHLDGSQGYCCNSSLSESRMCKQPAYTRLFKSACPRSYSANYGSGSDYDKSYYSCEGANYSVKFCPRSDTFSTIKVGSQLNSYDQLLSIRGNFTLGFFDDDGRRSYLGIWYSSDDTLPWKVWVANPNKPITTSFPDHALSIDPNSGNLIIAAGGTTLINITDILLNDTAHIHFIITSTNPLDHYIH